MRGRGGPDTPTCPCHVSKCFFLFQKTPRVEGGPWSDPPWGVWPGPRVSVGFGAKRRKCLWDGCLHFEECCRYSSCFSVLIALSFQGSPSRRLPSKRRRPHRPRPCLSRRCSQNRLGGCLWCVSFVCRKQFCWCCICTRFNYCPSPF